MARRTISLDEKIEKARTNVIAAKQKYDAALDELENCSLSEKSRMTRNCSSPITRATNLLMKSSLSSMGPLQNPFEG